MQLGGDPGQFEIGVRVREGRAAWTFAFQIQPVAQCRFTLWREQTQTKHMQTKRMQTKRMQTKFVSALALTAVATCLSGCGNFAPSRAAETATGMVSHQLCSAVFVSGLDPAGFYREAIDPMLAPAGFLFGHKVDRERAEVTATVAGLSQSRAVYRPPLGCVLVHGSPPPPVNIRPRSSTASLLPPIATHDIVQSANPALVSALDRAFEEPSTAPHRWTKAVVVVHDGHVLAERYAPGYGVDTPVAGWSATKSVTNALIGILVQQGQLKVTEPAPVAAWAGSGDPRHAITIDNLLRQTSGLDIGQSLTSSALSMFDPSSQMLFVESDMAAFAARAPLNAVPGEKWNYTDANTLLLSRIVRDQAGGDAASVHAFMHRELFDKLGMERVTMELDGAGTAIGSSHMLASARDWARLGMLYANDGIVGGVRLLPPGWVDYSATPTRGAEFGYGAGFWTNRGDGVWTQRRVRGGMPADSFMAMGNFGQYVVIIPSRRLVIARFGNSHTPMGDIQTVMKLVADVVAAVKDQ
jgi:CubicO group peptidase (beta-lactamase class C family)